jgi:hypothetical protein
MRPFKFFRTPLLTTHDGGDVYCGQYFYSMNKEDIVLPGKTTPKYSIVQRCIHPIYKDKFKPDHDLLWYFRSKHNAEYLRDIWIRQDNESGGEVFNRLSDMTITFNR